jgi:hypothetical protein
VAKVRVFRGGGRGAQNCCARTAGSEHETLELGHEAAPVALAALVARRLGCGGGAASSRRRLRRRLRAAGSRAWRHGAGADGSTWRWRRGGSVEEAALRSRRVRRRSGFEMKRRMRSERTVKRVRSAFYAMTGRCGRMIGRGGDSVQSHSSKLLERPDTSDYARSDADRVRSHFARKTETDDRTRWWLPRPDAVVSRDASDVASGHRS